MKVSLKPTKNQQSGFTLVEMMIVLMIIAMVAPLLYDNYPEKLGTRWSNQTVEQTMTIWDAARNYHVDNDKWPDEANNCANAIGVLTAGNYLGGVSATNAWNGAVTTTCTAGSPTMNINNTVSDNWVDYVVNNIAATQKTSSTTTRTFVPSPGTSVAFANVLSRKAIPGQPDRTKMETTLNMGNNDITNAKNITSSGVITASSTATGAESVFSHRVKANEVYDSKAGRYMAEMPIFRQVGNNTSIPWPSCPTGMVGKGVAFPIAPCTAELAAEPIDRFNIATSSNSTSKTVQFTLSVHSNNKWFTPNDSCGNMFAAVYCQTP